MTTRSKPIRMLVGVPPGGSNGSGGRGLLRASFLKTFGQPVIIDNRPGAAHFDRFLCHRGEIGAEWIHPFK